MDSHREDWAIESYMGGWRAYLVNGACQLQHPDHPGGVFCTDRETIKDFYALRSYQDEQRKKGVPILVSPMGALDASRWYHRSYKTPDTTFEFRFGTHSNNDSMPWINVFSAKNYHGVWAHAKFTNFRWRAGYPKRTGIGGIVNRIEDAQL